MKIYLSIKDFVELSGFSRDFISRSEHIVFSGGTLIDVLATADNLSKATFKKSESTLKAKALVEKVKAFSSEKTTLKPDFYVNLTDIMGRYNIDFGRIKKTLSKPGAPKPHKSDRENLYNLADIDLFFEECKVGKFSFHFAREFALCKYRASAV